MCAFCLAANNVSSNFQERGDENRIDPTKNNNHKETSHPMEKELKVTQYAALTAFSAASSRSSAVINVIPLSYKAISNHIKLGYSSQ